MEALTSGGITLKENISQTHGGKEVFGCNVFEILVEIKPLLDPKPNCPNYRFLSADKKLAITLYTMYAIYNSLWMTANTFRIHQCTVSKAIVEVCKAINAILCPDYLHLPSSENDLRK